jgi:hypothetical protein
MKTWFSLVIHGPYFPILATARDTTLYSAQWGFAIAAFHNSSSHPRFHRSPGYDSRGLEYDRTEDRFALLRADLNMRVGRY